VDEKGDMSHELLLSMYHQHGFNVGANATCTALSTALEREDFDWRQFSVQERCLLGLPLGSRDHRGHANRWSIVNTCLQGDCLIHCYNSAGVRFRRQYLLINDGDGQINYENFVYDCMFEELLLTRELARVREIENGTPATGKVTWTGLPKIERTHWVKDLDDPVDNKNIIIDDLDRERDYDYRERQREREMVQAHQHEGRKKKRTRTRIGCKDL
jgi:hypothetical protein